MKIIALAEGGGIGNLLMPFISLIFIALVIWIFYRMIKNLILVAVNKGNKSENRLEELQLLRAKDLITEEEYENKKSEILKKL